jgi:uncharacterized membrane protein YkvA (DUF1232 family)
MSKIVDWLAFPYSLYLLIKYPEISWKPKVKAGLILAVLFFYLLDPLDIIPDFIPLLGWLDDLLIIPIAMAVTAKVVPEVDIAGLRQKARKFMRRIVIWTIVIVTAMTLISLSALGLVIYLAIKYWR